jgi:chromosome segregation ATPase
MAAAAMDISDQGADTLAVADFQALEERVLRAVELLKAEREAHAAATAKVEELERHSAELERQLSTRADQSTRLESEIGQLQQERDHVRGRVERLLKHLDEFSE